LVGENEIFTRFGLCNNGRESLKNMTSMVDLTSSRKKKGLL
jgi:hypothetical protein